MTMELNGTPEDRTNLLRLSYYTLCRLADSQHVVTPWHLKGTLEMDDLGNFKGFVPRTR